MAPRSRSFRLGHARHGAVVSTYYSIPVNPTQAETTALLAAMTVQPNAARANLINNTIFALKNAGVWTKLDFIFMLAAHDAQAGRVNWITPANVAAEVSAPVFTVDRGYAGDGAAAHLTTGLNYSTLTNFKQDDASLGGWPITSVNSNNDIIGGASANVRFLRPWNGTTTSTRLNSSTSANFANTDSAIAHICVTRNAAAGHNQYRNGVFIQNVASVSGAIASDAVVLLRSQLTFTALQVGVLHGGKFLSTTEVASLYSALQTYLASLGAI